MGFYLIIFLAVIIAARVIESCDAPFFYEKRGHVLVGHTNGAKYVFILVTVALGCIAGLRYNVGADFGSYYINIPRQASELAERFRELDEPGTSVIAWVAMKINPTNPYQTGIFIEAILTVCVMAYAIYRNSEYLSFSLIMYLLMVWASCFNGIRQNLAAAVLVLGIPYLRERKLIKFLIVIAIAYLFHSSALVMLPLYFVVNRRTTIGNFILILIGSFVLLNSYELVFDLMGRFMSDVDTTAYTTRAVNILRTLVACAPAALFLILGLFKIEDTETRLWLNISLVHAALAIAASDSSYLARVTMYTDPFMAVAIPKLCLKIDPKLKSLLVVLMTVLYAAFWLYGLNKDPTARVFTFCW